MNVGFIGAGKVGITLGKYFFEKGVSISGYYNKTARKSSFASNLTNSKNFSNIDDVIKNSSVVFITVPDDIIMEIDEQIKLTNLTGKTLCHASGSMSCEILKNAKALGAKTYSIHPIFPFAGSLETKKLKEVVFSIEGGLVNDDLNELFSKIENKFFYRKDEQNVTYHLASVFASNLVLSLIETATDYLKPLGLTQAQSIETLMPLIKSNIENIQTNGFSTSLTGPVARGDIETVKKHFECLSDNDINLYKTLSINILEILARKHNLSLEEFLISSNKHMEIFNYLGGKTIEK